MSAQMAQSSSYYSTEFTLLDCMFKHDKKNEIKHRFFLFSGLPKSLDDPKSGRLAKVDQK